MTGQEAIDAFRIYFDRVTSFSAPGYLDAEILLFLNNAQDQFIDDKVFGKNFQPPAFEDNQKRVVDIRPLIKKAFISSIYRSTDTNYGPSTWTYDKINILSDRILYTVLFEVEVTRTNPTLAAEWTRCDFIKNSQAGKFTQSAANRTHFLYPKLLEDSDYYYVINDYYTTLNTSARIVAVRKPYPILSTSTEYTGTYDAVSMNLHSSVHQEIVNIAVEQALQAISDPRWQTKVSQEQINTN